MSIQRFETGPRMSQVVVNGNTIYLAGVVANKTAGGSVTDQTKEILSIIDGHLANAGSDKFTATTINVVRDRDSGYVKFEAATRLSIMRAALYQAVGVSFEMAAGQRIE